MLAVLVDVRRPDAGLEAAGANPRCQLGVERRVPPVRGVLNLLHPFGGHDRATAGPLRPVLIAGAEMPLQPLRPYPAQRKHVVLDDDHREVGAEELAEFLL